MRKIFLLAMLLFPFTLTAAPGDYCLGEWDVPAQDFCVNAMTYVQAVAVDRKVNRPKEALEHEIPTASKAYGIPEKLAQNYIDFIYQYDREDVDPNYFAYLMFGGCIDNFEVIKEQMETN